MYVFVFFPVCNEANFVMPKNILFPSLCVGLLKILFLEKKCKMQSAVMAVEAINCKRHTTDVHMYIYMSINAIFWVLSFCNGKF